VTYRILVLDTISPAGLERFPKDRYAVGPDLERPDAVLVRSRDLHSMEIGESVKAVGRAGIGVDNIPVEALTARGVVVFNTPGANANAVKELVVAGLFLAARRITAAWDFVRGLAGDSAAVSEAVEQGKKQFIGFELTGRTLGVVGLGAVGGEVANAALALGMRVIGFDPALSVLGAWRLSSEVQQAGSLDTLFMDSEIVTIHVPLNDGTKGMVDARRIALMRQGAVLLNFARAQLVDDTAVVAALDRGHLAAYVTDFPTPAVKGHPLVTALPHIGASTAEAQASSVVMAADQLRDFLEHGAVRHSVNFPDALLARHQGSRIAIANENVPGVVGRISTALAEAGLNISEMHNGSKGDYAYTLVDVDGPVPPKVFEDIRRLGGVLSARLL